MSFEEVPFEEECIICHKLRPFTSLNFFPFMKGGVCDGCRTVGFRPKFDVLKSLKEKMR